MDYNLGSVLTSKCIFCYDLILIFFIGTRYMIHDGKTMLVVKRKMNTIKQLGKKDNACQRTPDILSL
jgi:hypothetical protein